MEDVVSGEGSGSGYDSGEFVEKQFSGSANRLGVDE
jgi:hypothetical protein